MEYKIHKNRIKKSLNYLKLPPGLLGPLQLRDFVPQLILEGK